MDAARKAYEDALAAHDRARHRAEQLADLAPQLGGRLDELEPLAARAAEARALADLAAGLGANTLRMTLSPSCSPPAWRRSRPRPASGCSR